MKRTISCITINQDKVGLHLNIDGQRVGIARLDILEKALHQLDKKSKSHNAYFYSIRKFPKPHIVWKSYSYWEEYLLPESLLRKALVCHSLLTEEQRKSPQNYEEYTL